jgi:nucleoid DNA-binding protein
MNKTNIIKKLSDKTMIAEDDSAIIFNVIFDIIKESLINGDKVMIRKFGTFFIQNRKARIASDPKDNSIKINVPAKNVIKFKPSKSLNERV